MGTNRKTFNVNVPAAKKMYDDIGVGNVRTYTTASFSSIKLTDVHPDSLLEKCIEVQVAVSGDSESDRMWMAVLPLRVDCVSGTPGSLELQGDMSILVFAGDHTTPIPSGIVAYHQGFDGQNVPIEQFRNLSREEATDVLRLYTVEEKKGIQQANHQFLATLNGMINKYRPQLLTFGQVTTE